MHFDSIDLALFVNIAETGNLTRGAHKSYMSVPAASMRIKTIEDRLCTQLFYRTNQGLRVAPAGQVFLHYGRQVLRQLSDLEGELREYSIGAKGSVRLLANPTAVTEFLPSSLKQYLSLHHDINIELREHTSAEVVRSVMDGTADIGIFAGDISTHDLQVLPYRQYRNVIAVGPDHPLAHHKEIAFEQTLAYDYISLIEGARHNFLTQAAHALHKPLKLRIQVHDPESMCSMVEMNVGIAMLPGTTAYRFARKMNIRIIELRDSWAMRDLRICVRDRAALPPSSENLVKFLANDTGTDAQNIAVSETAA